MLLAIDVGNTNVVLGLLEDQKLLQTWRLGTHPEYTSDECSAIIRSLFDLAGIDRARVQSAIISCVVPPLLRSSSAPVPRALAASRSSSGRGCARACRSASTTRPRSARTAS